MTEEDDLIRFLQTIFCAEKQQKTFYLANMPSKANWRRFRAKVTPGGASTLVKELHFEYRDRNPASSELRTFLSPSINPSKQNELTADYFSA